MSSVVRCSTHAMVPYYHPGTLNSEWKLQSISFVVAVARLLVFFYFDRVYRTSQIAPLKVIKYVCIWKIYVTFSLLKDSSNRAENTAEVNDESIQQSGHSYDRDRAFAMQICSLCCYQLFPRNLVRGQYRRRVSVKKTIEVQSKL